MKYTFLVSVDDPIVQMDLMGALKANFPEATVMPLSNIDDLPKQIDQSRSPICIFFSNRIWTEETHDVLLTIVERGGRIVTLGPPKMAELPAIILDLPFTTQMVLDVLSNDCCVQPAPQPEVQT